MSDDDSVRELVRAVRAATGVDFDQYRTATLERRIRTRQAMLGLASLDEYASVARRDPLEVRQLGELLLVPTTEMFRDPETYALLREELLPELVARRVRAGARQLRIWSAGCATGDEAFSLAACAAIEVERHARVLDVAVLASDVSAQSLERAARGVVPAARAANVPDDVRERFLVESGEVRRVAPDLLERVTFCRHDLLDPDRTAPSAAVVASFDVVACRNVLIYLDVEARRRTFERLLKVCAPGGLLILGTAESLPASMGELVTQPRRAHHVYVRSG